MARFVEVTEDCLSVDKYVRLVTSPKAGAISTFIGTTRDTFEGMRAQCGNLRGFAAWLCVALFRRSMK